eukprot:c32295_g1_i1 orf=174-401(+)
MNIHMQLLYASSGDLMLWKLTTSDIVSLTAIDCASLVGMLLKVLIIMFISIHTEVFREWNKHMAPFVSFWVWVGR